MIPSQTTYSYNATAVTKIYFLYRPIKLAWKLFKYKSIFSVVRSLIVKFLKKWNRATVYQTNLFFLISVKEYVFRLFWNVRISTAHFFLPDSEALSSI